MSSTSIADVRKKDIEKEVSAFMKVSEPVVKYMTNDQKTDLIEQLNHEMINAAKDLEFERAASLRDEIEKLKKLVK